MVGSAERSAGHQGLAGRKQPYDAVDLGRLQGFLQGERRQDGCQAFGQHRFAGSGRPDKQDVVTAGGGNFQGALYRFLAFDFGEIVLVIVGVLENAVDIDPGGRDFQFAFEEAGGFAQVADGNDLQTVDDGGFGRVFGRDEDAGLSLRLGRQRDRQNPFDGADGASEGEFADHDEIIELVGFDLSAGGEHADRDRQVEARAFLFYISGRKVDRGA